MQQRAQRKPAGHGVGIRLVVEENQDAIGILEIASILLNARARQRSAELGEQRRFEELGQRKVPDVREVRAHRFGALLAIGRPHSEHVDQRAAGVADGVDHPRQIAPAGVFDNHDGLR